MWTVSYKDTPASRQSLAHFLVNKVTEQYALDHVTLKIAFELSLTYQWQNVLNSLNKSCRTRADGLVVCKTHLNIGIYLLQKQRVRQEP